MKKNRTELLWNYASVGTMAISGLIMTSSVAFFYNSSVLGVFNECYAWYMILSQLATWGIHMSILKYVPENDNGKEKLSILKAAEIIVLLISVIVLIVGELVLFLPEMPVWRRSMRIALLGIPFFSLNKVLINYFNAIYELIAVAVFQIIRYVLLAVVVLALAFWGVDSDNLTISFAVSELLVFSCISIYLVYKRMTGGRASFAWIQSHLEFGTKILPSNMVVEMNTKVDIVCLGFLIKDTSQIGVYSYAILFTEGFYMIYYTVRKIINPGISEYNSKGILDEYIAKVDKQLKKYLIPCSLLSYLAVLGTFFVAYLIFCSSDEYIIGGLYITIICFAIMVNGKSIIWGDFLGQTGYPFEESLVNIRTIVSNIIGNVILIVSFGTIGASIATGLSHFVYGFTQKKSILNKVGLRL